MSYRGSFSTEYIYCRECFDVINDILDGVSPEENGKKLPILCGKVGSSYIGGEVQDFEDVAARIEGEICHPVRISVIAEIGEKIFFIEPSKG